MCKSPMVVIAKKRYSWKLAFQTRIEHPITFFSESRSSEASPSSQSTIRRHSCAVWSDVTNWQASWCEVVGDCR